MTVKVTEIKKFYEMWTPIMETIPAVLDLADQQSQAKRELILLQEQLKGVEEAITQKTEAAEANLLELARLSGEANTEWQEALLRGEEAREAHKQAVKEAEVVESKKLKDLQAKTAEATAKLAGLEAEITAKRDAALAEISELVAGKQAELEAVEKRKDAAEKALEKLRNQLG